MKRKITTVGTMLTLLALLAYIGAARRGVGAQARDEGANAPQIEGTWRVTVTPPPGGPPAYISFASFASGGVMITSPDPSVSPTVTSTGQGTWERTQANEFASTHVAFTYDASGHIVGTIKINSNYKLTGKDSFEGNGLLQFCDASLNNCFTIPGCATLHGERIHAEPPSCP